jgi:hypothetical protein
MKTFNDLVFEPHVAGMGGVMSRMFFGNGYGISVVRFMYSYGGSEGLYEVAVLKENENGWDLCYDTPITDDVIGHLDEIEVSEIMEQIQALK